MAKAKASKTSLATSKPNEVAIPNLLDENSGTVPEFFRSFGNRWTATDL